MTRARSPSARISLSMTISPTSSKSRASTTLRASLSMTSWPRTRSSRSTVGLTFTRSLRPPVKTSIESSSLRPRKVPKPAGGCASRSTSSLRATIWSRASRRVWASRSFWAVTAARERCVSARRSSRPRVWPGASASWRRRTATSSSRKRTWFMSSSGLRPPLPGTPADADMTSRRLPGSLPAQRELREGHTSLCGCRLKPLDHKDCRGVSDLHPCALPHARGIPTNVVGKPAVGSCHVSGWSGQS